MVILVNHLDLVEFVELVDLVVLADLVNSNTLFPYQIPFILLKNRYYFLVIIS